MAGPVPGASGVTPREAEVLSLLGDHLSHAEIAGRLVLSVRTVESHVASLRRKLGAESHRELVRYAAGLGRGGLPRRAGPTTSFVGRRPERAALAEAMRTSRLVTLIGAGGAGKTRLAREVVDDLDGASWLVDLVPVTDDASLVAAVAEASGLADQPGGDAREALRQGLADRDLVLVLDNAEHVADGVARLVDDLLGTCPGLTVLVTSRSRLALPDEHVVTVGGLPPEEAVTLFVDRAAAAGWAGPVGDDVRRVRAVCVALAGLPLAVELAAARVPSLGLDGVERGLGDHGALLRVGARSMHETLEWSRSLLPTVDRAVLARVSVLAAAFEVEAAQSVAAYGQVSVVHVEPALARLSEQSLISVLPDGRRTLLEPVRQFAVATMGPEDQRARDLHVAWALAGGRDLVEPPRDGVADELRAALAWVTSQDRDGDACEVATMLAEVLFATGRLREAGLRFEQAASLAGESDRRIDLLVLAADVARCRELGDVAYRLELEALRTGRRSAPGRVPRLAVRAAETLARFQGMLTYARDPAEVAALLAEALAGDPGGDVRRRAELVTMAAEEPTTGIGLRERAEAALADARDAGDVLRASAAADLLTFVLVSDPAAGVVEAALEARRRVAAVLSLRPGPETALEVKDALHMAVLTCVGAGELPAALAYAESQGELPYLREQRDVAVEESLLPLALAGRWADLDARAATFLEDWTAAGRPPGAGRAMGPAAVALAYGLRDRATDRATWLAVVARMRGVPTPLAFEGSGYGAVFDALLALHEGRPGDAWELAVRSASDPGWHSPLIAPWRAAVEAEALALTGGSAAEVSVAGAVAAGSPLCSAVVERAAVLAEGGLGEQVEAWASRFERLGSPYQAERTRRLSGS